MNGMTYKEIKDAVGDREEISISFERKGRLNLKIEKIKRKIRVNLPNICLI